MLEASDRYCSNQVASIIPELLDPGPILHHLNLAISVPYSSLSKNAYTNIKDVNDVDISQFFCRNHCLPSSHSKCHAAALLSVKHFIIQINNRMDHKANTHV